jgi:hypothetical protein
MSEPVIIIRETDENVIPISETPDSALNYVQEISTGPGVNYISTEDQALLDSIDLLTINSYPISSSPTLNAFDVSAVPNTFLLNGSPLSGSSLDIIALPEQTPSVSGFFLQTNGTSANWSVVDTSNLSAETATTIAAIITGADTEDILEEGDLFGFSDISATPDIIKKTTWSNIKTLLQTWANGLYVIAGGKSGGQTIVGGTDAADDLILKATSGNAASTGQGNIILKTGNDGATTALTVDYNGYVGIGTVDSTAKFRIVGKAATTGEAFKITDSNLIDRFKILDNGRIVVTSNIANNYPNNAGVHFTNAAIGGRTDLIVYNSGGESGVYSVFGPSFSPAGYGNNTQMGASKSLFLVSDAQIANGGSSYISFMTGGYTLSTQERMRINSSGGIGIGITEPAARLHIKGGASDGSTTTLKLSDATGTNTVFSVLDNGETTIAAQTINYHNTLSLGAGGQFGNALSINRGTTYATGIWIGPDGYGSAAEAIMAHGTVKIKGKELTSPLVVQFAGTSEYNSETVLATFYKTYNWGSYGANGVGVGLDLKANTTTGVTTLVAKVSGIMVDATNGAHKSALRLSVSDSSGTREGMRIVADGTGTLVGINTTTPVSKLHVAGSPTVSANYGTFSLGGGAFDGTTSGYFVGDATALGGTSLAINEVSTFAGNFIDCQLAGSSKFKVSKAGNITCAALNSSTGTSWGSSLASPFLSIGDSDPLVHRWIYRGYFQYPLLDNTHSLGAYLTDGFLGAWQTLKEVAANALLSFNVRTANWEMAKWSWVNNIYTLATSKAGTGTVRDVAITAPNIYLNGSVTQTGSIKALVTKTFADTGYTLTASDYTVLVNATDGATSVVLPDANGHNLFKYSEQFHNAAWTKTYSTITANSVVAPDGATSADTLIESVATDWHGVRQSVGGDGIPKTLSVYAKANTRNWLCLNLNYSGNHRAWFDLQNGVLGTVESGNTATITSVGNGWYRCTLYRATDNNNVDIDVANANGAFSYLGDGSSIYIWGAQLELTSTANTYTPTTAVGLSTSNVNRLYNIKKIDSSANAVTINTTSSQTIDGATSQVLTAQNESISLQSDGSNWYMISRLII